MVGNEKSVSEFYKKEGCMSRAISSLPNRLIKGYS